MFFPVPRGFAMTPTPDVAERIGTDTHSDALKIRVPFVLMDDGLGPRWYPAPMSNDEADRMVEAINTGGGNARVVRRDVTLPAACELSVVSP